MKERNTHYSKVGLVLPKVAWADPWVITITTQGSAHTTFRSTRTTLAFSSSFKIFLLEKGIYISVSCIISLEMTTVKSDFAFAKVELRNLYSKQQQLSWGIGKNCESTMCHRGATKNYRQARPNLTKIYLATLGKQTYQKY